MRGIRFTKINYRILYILSNVVWNDNNFSISHFKTHDLLYFRGVWHDAKSYPKSWQLDPTEGPGRVRKRLKRCHLGIENRFLTPDNQYKLGRAFNINFHFFIFMNF